MKPLVWTTEPKAPELSPAEAAFFLNGGVQAEVEAAFRDGLVVDYERRTVGPGNRDLEIKIVLRHKSTLPKPV